MTGQIQVFRDMNIRGPAEKRANLRAALIEAATKPWRVDLERSAEVARNAVTSEDVVLFRTEAGAAYPAAGLTLWETHDGYHVPNIVPLETGNLTYAQYNAVLEDFIKRIAGPIVKKLGFEISATKAEQTLDDWISEDAALKLRRFSGAANKSTGASHPSDERRWFDFIVAVHRSGDRLYADQLARWLCEADGWSEDTAHRLAGDYEGSLALLKYYDEH